MKRLIICLLVALGINTAASAQMAGATKIKSVVEKTFTLNSTTEKVWEYLMEPTNFVKFAGVKSYTCKDHTREAMVTVVNKAGETREQKISFLHYETHKLCYFVEKSPYMKELWIYGINLKDVNGKCEVNFFMHTGSVSKTIPALNKAVEQEFNDMKAGLEKVFGK